MVVVNTQAIVSVPKPLIVARRAAGKPRKVALCAAARKLLRIAWAVATKEQDFDPTYASRLRSEAVAE